MTKELHLITKNFVREEFDCHDGTAVPGELLGKLCYLVENLQVLRDLFERPIVIISGYRTERWNFIKNGAPQSLHLTAQAADIRVVGATIVDLHQAALHHAAFHGIGLYDSWVHVDVRSGPRVTWDKRKHKVA